MLLVLVCFSIGRKCLIDLLIEVLMFLWLNVLLVVENIVILLVFMVWVCL